MGCKLWKLTRLHEVCLKLLWFFFYLIFLFVIFLNLFLKINFILGLNKIDLLNIDRFSLHFDLF